MIHKPIYIPKARAREYGDMAINIYRGCPHGCTYCFAPGILRMSREAFSTVSLRGGIVESVKRQIERERITGKLIHLCFTCDPYPADFDTAPTRAIIEIIKGSGNNVQILTKAGMAAERDFDLLDGGDMFGVTFTSQSMTEPHENEPNAAPSLQRLATLSKAKRQGIQTWVSCEPVFEPEAVYALIQSADYIDLYRIGKMNHRPSGINWAEFGARCIELCEKHGRRYYIKEDLQNEITKGGTGNET